MRIPMTVILVLLATVAHADPVYKQIDKQGVVHYSDKPANPKDKPVNLPELQVIRIAPPKAAAAATGGGAAPADGLRFAGAGPSVAIGLPAANAKLDQGKFTVTADLSQPLADGQALQYYLDDEPVNPEPTQSTALLYADVSGGDHLLCVAVLENGRELTRSESIMVHIGPKNAVKKRPASQ